MKRPAIQFYPGDFLKDPCVQILSFEAKSVWLFMILLMHDSVRYGYLVKANGKPISSKQLANALQISEERIVAAWAEMEDSGTFSKTVESIIYCRRMARDEELSSKRSEAGRQGGLQAKAKQTPSKIEAKPPSSSSSSSSTSVINPPKAPPRAGGRSRQSKIERRLAALHAVCSGESA